MEVYKKILKYGGERKNNGIIAILLAIVASFLLVAPFWFLWRFFNSLLVTNNNSEALHDAKIIIFCMIGYVCIYFLALWNSHLLAFRVESNMRKKGTEHLMNASFSFFDLNSSGKIRKIIDDNAAKTHMIVAHLIPDLICAMMVPILMFITIFAIDLKLAILFTAVTITAVFFVKGMSGGKEFMDIYTKSLEDMNSQAVEYVRGMQVIKIFKTTIKSYKSFYSSIMDYSKYVYGYALKCRFSYVTFQIMFTILITFTIPFAIYFINKGANPMEIVSQVVFFGCFAGVIFDSLMKVMYVSMYAYEATSAIDNLENLFEDMENKKLSRGSETKINNFDIEFKDVSFKYNDNYVLENLSFKLKERKSYALMGSSGSGKSTIAKLISGFYSIDEGGIFIGGKNITSYTEETVLNNIAFVFQNSKLFKTSIYENVKIANPKASHEDIIKALTLAKCDDILDKFESRENTVIGSEGVYLSGGEVQRIAIARAILKDANIIILDEASAAADPENEFEIQQAFTNLIKNKTVIMIAHRLSSIRNCDEILVIDNGKVIERGNDKELVELNGRYKYLQNLYSKANDWRVA